MELEHVDGHLGSRFEPRPSKLLHLLVHALIEITLATLPADAGRHASDHFQLLAPAEVHVNVPLLNRTPAKVTGLRHDEFTSCASASRTPIRQGPARTR